MNKIIIGIVLAYLTVIAVLAEKYLFTCNSTDGKKVYAEALTNKGLANFIRYGYFISIVVGFGIIGLMMYIDSSAQFLLYIMLGALVLLSLISWFMLMIDSKYTKGQLEYHNRSPSNWTFIRVISLISLISIIIFNIVFIGSICRRDIEQAAIKVKQRVEDGFKRSPRGSGYEFI